MGEADSMLNVAGLSSVQSSRTLRIRGEWAASTSLVLLNFTPSEQVSTALVCASRQSGLRYGTSGLTNLVAMPYFLGTSFESYLVVITCNIETLPSHLCMKDAYGHFGQVYHWCVKK